MIVTRDYRRGGGINIKMDVDEFVETVEWLEMVDPRDGATRDWRKALDRVVPPNEDDE